MQYAKFPMKYVNITQTPNNAFSHKGSVSAWDNAGKDSGIDDVFAPFDCKVVWKDTGSAKTGILVQNTNFVQCADGLIREPNSIKLLSWHDNNIRDLKVDQLIKQGQVFYQEGTAGHATGNHAHFNVGIGKYDGKYPLVKNEFGVWEIKGEIDPTKIFYIEEDNIIVKTNGMNWNLLKDKIVNNLEEVEEQTIKVGSIVKIIGDKWSTGSKIPQWAKLKSYKVEIVSNDKALLSGIKSWAFVKDLKIV